MKISTRILKGIMTYYPELNDNDLSKLFDILNTHTIYDVGKTSNIWFKFECKKCNGSLDNIVGRGSDVLKNTLTCNEMVIKNILE